MSRCPATQLSLEYLRLQNKVPWIVERLIPSKPFPKRVDLFNLFDLLYLDPDLQQIGFVQTTSWTNRHSRKKKMEAGGEPFRVLWSMPSARTELHAWRKVDGRWEVFVWESRFSYTPFSQGDGGMVILQSVQVPTMAEARAMARARERGIISDTCPDAREGRTIRRIS